MIIKVLKSAKTISIEIYDYDVYDSFDKNKSIELSAINWISRTEQFNNSVIK